MSSAAAQIDDFLWKNRLLIVSVSNENALLLAEQSAIFDDHYAGMNDRDLKLISLVAERVYVNEVSTDQLDAAFMREQYDLPNQGVAILVGKDGTVKLRRDAAISAAELFSVIDRMPMRRREMKDRG
ncbi:DUF4174 domain-containing protein [Pseudovibrio exalbescens]|nr:DUF4174 domain-containing protein [Pseudovibrio exalbescens]